MYKKQQKGWLKHLDFIILDLICLVGSYALAFFLRHGDIKGLFANSVYVNTGIVLLVFDLLVVVLFDTMHNILRRGYLKELTAVVKEDLIVFGCIAIYLFSVKDGAQVSRITLWVTMVLHIISSYLVFIEWKRVIKKRHINLDKRSMLLVADKDQVREVLERFKSYLGGTINISGIVLADSDVSGGKIEGVPIVCSLLNAPKYICREWIDDVYVCTMTPPSHLIERCNEMGVTVHRELHTTGSDQQFVEKIAGKYVLTSAMKSATPGQMLAKRILDQGSTMAWA